MKLKNEQQLHTKKTIDQILIAARIIDGFWDRWIAHGVRYDDITKVRHHLSTHEKWVSCWIELAEEKQTQAHTLCKEGDTKSAESMFRLSGLYYYLAQWINPEIDGNKKSIYLQVLEMFEQADSLSRIITEYQVIHLSDYKFYGRVRIPKNPKGCILLISPFDSAKEELYTYEADFIDGGFITVCFDGPGQGETFLSQNLKATKERWDHFIKNVILHIDKMFPSLPISLFGTSSGASWSVFFSDHPLVNKTIAVSPAMRVHDSSLPLYFLDRLRLLVEGEDEVIPDILQAEKNNPILIFHGGQDVMIPKIKMELLLERLQNHSFIEYEEEGHCCNYKLNELRKKAMDWLM